MNVETICRIKCTMEQRDHVRNSRGATPNRQLKNGDDADFRESEDDIFSQE